MAMKQMVQFKTVISVVSDISNHFSQFCVIISNTSKPTTRNTVKNQYRDFSLFSKEIFNNDLAQIEFDEPNVNNANSIDKIFSRPFFRKRYQFPVRNIK
jgi:hypothetical protein